MKITVLKMMSGIFAVCLVMAIVSCSKNDPTPTPNPPTPTEVKADVSYTIGNMYDLHELMDITITYKDSTGIEHTGQLEKTPAGITYKGVKLPFATAFKIEFKRKAGIEYTKEAYQTGRGYNLSYKRTNGSGTSVNYSGSSSVAKGKIEAFLIKLEEKPRIDSIHVGLTD